MLVIVTRPANSGQRLCERLLERGYRAWWWPVFDIGAAPDAQRARAILAGLADYDLAIFVSANAVHAAQALLCGAWPPGTMLGAVGASTRAAIEIELKPPSSLLTSAHDEDQESGSEAFWRAWQATKRHAERVLLVRAQDGRTWLGERFEEQGAQVDVVAVYSRSLHQPSADELQRLHESIEADEAPSVIFSSTEAVAALDRQVGTAAQEWLRSGTAIACHPRIAEELLSKGYGRVLNATFGDDSIVAQLESIGVEPQAP